MPSQIYTQVREPITQSINYFIPVVHATEETVQIEDGRYVVIAGELVVED